MGDSSEDPNEESENPDRPSLKGILTTNSDEPDESIELSEDDE